jgi:hypothetical protein
MASLTSFGTILIVAMATMSCLSPLASLSAVFFGLVLVVVCIFTYYCVRALRPLVIKMYKANRSIKGSMYY